MSQEQNTKKERVPIVITGDVQVRPINLNEINKQLPEINAFILNFLDENPYVDPLDMENIDETVIYIKKLHIAIQRFVLEQSMKGLPNLHRENPYLMYYLFFSHPTISPKIFNFSNSNYNVVYPDNRIRAFFEKHVSMRYPAYHLHTNFASGAVPQTNNIQIIVAVILAIAGISIGVPNINDPYNSIPKTLTRIDALEKENALLRAKILAPKLEEIEDKEEEILAPIELLSVSKEEAAIMMRDYNAAISMRDYETAKRRKIAAEQKKLPNLIRLMMTEFLLWKVKIENWQLMLDWQKQESWGKHRKSQNLEVKMKH